MNFKLQQMKPDFKNIGLALSIWVFMQCGCSPSTPQMPPMFTVLQQKETGITFANNLHPTPEFNMFRYMYYYNGAGIGAGDFNNDGLIDLFFASNETQNSIYLNQGKMKFKDVTKEAEIPSDKAWNTGVSVVDINNDGLLDIYICRLGQFGPYKTSNQLLVCQGIRNNIPYYKDEAKKYGLDFSGFSTQMAFFDYDMDGDLDAFLLNHSVHQNGTFAPRNTFLGTFHPLSGDQMFRNDNGFYTDVTKQSNINSSAISYGLGVAIGDINLDGWPDLYAGNDFHENDYLYINQKNGVFKDESHDRLMHTSQYSMGVDIADANNDGFPEIVSMDMLPKDPYILKRSLGEDDYDIYKYKISVGYDYQFTRNNLQWNRRNGHFSEIGMYAGIYATDWSWATLWMDFDNDGSKDLFVANGIPKRMNDIDYVNFVSNKEIQEKIRDDKMEQKDMGLVDRFPEIKIPNNFFLNQKNMSFSDISNNINNNPPSYSNGAAYADFDNDGDLDIVVNNVNDAAFIYQNNTADSSSHSVTIQLMGNVKNMAAIGAKIVLFAGKEIRTYEKYPVRGFLSSMEVPLLLGLKNTKVDSAYLIWPDNSFQNITIKDGKHQTLKFTYQKGLPQFNYQIITQTSILHSIPFQDITASTGIKYLHQENVFQEFNREPLIPHFNSTEGPALAIADINKDGLEDIFIGAARSFTGAIYLQKAGGTFDKVLQPALSLDSNYEDVDAIWQDVNNDGNVDLVVASGGNEYYGKDENMLSRVYLNNGEGHLTKKANALPVYGQFSKVIAQDFNKDGYVDLMLFGRVTPMNFGAIPDSYLLMNNKDGSFRDVTAENAPAFKKLGMVTNAVQVDINKDGNPEIVVCYEWGGIDAFELKSGKYIKEKITTLLGWWNVVIPVDIDGDGDMDLVAGNLGLNSRLKASKEEPIRLYNNDFDGNGRPEQIMSYYLQGKEIPFAGKDEIQRQLPMVKKSFLYAEDFAKATIDQIFSRAKLDAATVSTAYHFANTLFINEGNFKFRAEDLPWEAQQTAYKSGIVCDANGDKLPDVLLMGNYYDNNVQMGRYDADYGTLLLNQGKGKMIVEPLNGLQVKGQVRKIQSINIGGKKSFVLARNKDTMLIIN